MNLSNRHPQTKTAGECPSSVIGLFGFGYREVYRERRVIRKSLGSDAFYYKKRPEGFDRLLSTGKVEIENEVEIGASCTIDRGVSATTRIGSGTKIDNQVHIGHDTLIGRNVLLAAQVGIAGCAVLEDEVTLWGQVGVNSSVCIGEKAVVLGQAGVTKSLEGNKTYFGTPSEDAQRKFRELAALRNLPTALEQI